MKLDRLDVFLIFLKIVRHYIDDCRFVYSIGTLSILSLITCWTASGFHLGVSIVRNISSIVPY